MTSDGIRARIRTFFSEAFPGRSLTDDDNIFSLGFGNSLLAMQLVEFIESEFAIPVDNEDLDIDNFRTITAIGMLAERKTAAVTAA